MSRRALGRDTAARTPRAPCAVGAGRRARARARLSSGIARAAGLALDVDVIRFALTRARGRRGACGARHARRRAAAARVPGLVHDAGNTAGGRCRSACAAVARSRLAATARTSSAGAGFTGARRARFTARARVVSALARGTGLGGRPGASMLVKHARRRPARVREHQRERRSDCPLRVASHRPESPRHDRLRERAHPSTRGRAGRVALCDAASRAREPQYGRPGTFIVSWKRPLLFPRPVM
jgi:hypothetical protein